MLQEKIPESRSEAVADASPDAAWIWSQDPTRYTIQLAAAGNEAAVLAVKQQVSLPDELAVAKALRDGEPWFVLVYGSFPSKESARDTINRLPSELKQSGPWARSFSSLQDELSRSTPPQ
jgi:DamX protein